MRIPLLGGRDFRRNETGSKAAISNRAFAKEYFRGKDPVGKSFDRGKDRFRIIGLVRDARYRNLREPITPAAYIPLGFSRVGALNLFVRMANTNSMALAPMLRREVSRARPEFRVSNVLTQLELNQAQMVPERLLATLALFFAGLAVLLAGIGFYGVLDYSVLQRRRELGIRIAIEGSRPDLGVLAVPSAVVLLATSLAALPAVMVHSSRSSSAAESGVEAESPHVCVRLALF